LTKLCIEEDLKEDCLVREGEERARARGESWRRNGEEKRREQGEKKTDTTNHCSLQGQAPIYRQRMALAVTALVYKHPTSSPLS
jgi:hypothetical protein